MENIISIKKKLGKIFGVIYAILIIIFSVISVFSYAEYNNYKERQEFAVDMTLNATSQFNKYKGDYKTLVEKMYNFYNPIHLKNSVIDNTRSVETARNADKVLGKVLSNAGFPCTYGSYYLKYVGFVDYTIHKKADNYIPLFIIGGIFIILNLLYCIDRQNSITVFSDRIICKKGKKVVKEFFVKDVKSVELSLLKGVKIRGNGIKYKINLLKNAEDIKTFIMDILATISNENSISIIQDNSAESIKKFKELLDNGVITQEEFDEKKKQLLGL